MSSGGGAANSRSVARDLLVRALYQWQIAGHSESELADQFGARSEYTHCDQSYFKALLALAITDADAADAIITRHAVRSIEQLDAVGHAVLLLAIAELTHRIDVPTRVVINEAVTLTKRYGAAESYKFINAVLDKAARAMPERAAADSA